MATGTTPWTLSPAALRPALEDLLGAGAVIAALEGAGLVTVVRRGRERLAALSNLKQALEETARGTAREMAMSKP
jgi:DNA-binding transcriptional ArsR family regulator